MAVVLSRQLDVFLNPGGNSEAFPFVAVLQADAVNAGRSVIVAPLVPAGAVPPSLLTPHVEVAGRRLALVVADLAAVPRARLTEAVGTLSPERHRIVRALDYLFTGV